MDVWKDLQPLFRNRKIGSSAAVVFGVIWEFVGCQVTEKATINTKWIAKALGLDRSSVLAQIKKLHRIHDLLHVRERDRAGRYSVDVYRPAPGHAEAKPDPQRVLPGFSESDIIEPQAVEEPAAVGCGIQGESQEHQRSGFQGRAPSNDGRSAGEPQCLTSAETAPRPRRGENPTRTADSWGIPHASPTSTVGNSPQSSQCKHGEFPTPIETAENAGVVDESRPVGISPQDGRGEFPTAPNADGAQYTPACARVFNDSSTEESLLNGLNDSKTQRLKDLKDAKLVAGLQADIDRRRQQSEREAGRREARPSNVLADSTAVLVEALTPDAQKRRLVAEFRKLVNDPGTKEWLFGYAADLLIVHGQDSTRQDAPAIYNRITGVLKELRMIRQAQTSNGQVHGPRGAWFNIRVVGIARDHGIPLPHQIKEARLERYRQQMAATTH